MKQEEKDFIKRVRENAFLRNFVLSREVLDFIACQFALESDYGRCNLAKYSHNYCGMCSPHRRIFYGSSSANEFAKYDTFDSCVIDYISWLLYNRPTNCELKNLSDFKRFLRNNGYCPEKDYIDKINSIYQQLKV